MTQIEPARAETGEIMKIAVCGKGGVGKTFIAGCLAGIFFRHGHSVLAIDADSNPNLALTLGLTPDESSRIVPVAENSDLIRLKTGTEYSGVFRLTFSVEDIVEKYAVRTPVGPGLLVMGTVRAMGSGCTCPAHSLIKALLRHLVVERGEMVVLDMEAGLEHLGRGTAEHVDVLLVVTDANWKSRETAASIIRLSQGSSVRKVLLVANRIGDNREELIVQSFAREQNVPLVAVIPSDKQVAEAGIEGFPVRNGDSAAAHAVAELAQALLQPAGMIQE